MTREEAIETVRRCCPRISDSKCDFESAMRVLVPELRESEDEGIRKEIIDIVTSYRRNCVYEGTHHFDDCLAWLEKQKENPKSADSIPSDCVPNVKCEDRWHKVQDFLPDNGRLVLAQDNLGNRLLARYDGEGNWEVSVYDNEDYYCRNTITKWCEIPSEQKEQKPVEWSEEDEKTIWGLTAYIPNEELERLGVTRDDILKKLKSFRPHPIQLKEAYKDGFQTSRHAMALAFMNNLDENRPKGKMGLSNGECEDIDKAFKEGDWAKIMRYVEKYRPQSKQEWSEGDKEAITTAIRACRYMTENFENSTKQYEDAIERLKSLHPHWKPSEEQMVALHAMNCLGELSYQGQQQFLIDLYQQLKKLM